MSVKSIVKNHSDCFSESCVRNKKIQQNQASSGFDGIAKMIAKKQTTITPSPHSSGCSAVPREYIPAVEKGGVASGQRLAGRHWAGHGHDLAAGLWLAAGIATRQGAAAAGTAA